jgi:hypothetical protein
VCLSLLRIVETAELGLDYGSQLDYLRVNNSTRRSGPISGQEATFSGLSKVRACTRVCAAGSPVIIGVVPAACVELARLLDLPVCWVQASVNFSMDINMDGVYDASEGG